MELDFNKKHFHLFEISILEIQSHFLKLEILAFDLKSSLEHGTFFWGLVD